MNDPRARLAAAQDWVAKLIDHVDHSQLPDPTPCTEFDVRQLLGHLFTGASLVTALAEGTDPMEVPFVSEIGESDWGGDYRAITRRAREAWPEPLDLDTVVTIPRGEVTLGGALAGWVGEALTHGWDLATATGQPSEADPVLAEFALAGAAEIVPAQLRVIPEVPFETVVEPAVDAGPTERLANFFGRVSRQPG
ncbi:TIGR03086 family metal-binding protein [Naumannella halotolerans]|uniref:Uncharacterized protein (TIGR03086 family) n=1 Tax=Naumannella halotolerans TaxID=993414 RepID=A0A4R7J9D5_9ACTN|nr:TIGR03086 family metal-binding protein [Naumannella halotolerans]TDT34130.1 uncharacterized protein (TIGR03086 family) [Naumannella halotolerans]